MTPPIPQREPMLALPEPTLIRAIKAYTPSRQKIVICKIENVGRNTWLESHNFKGGYF